MGRLHRDRYGPRRWLRRGHLHLYCGGLQERRQWLYLGYVLRQNAHAAHADREAEAYGRRRRRRGEHDRCHVAGCSLLQRLCLRSREGSPRYG